MNNTDREHLRILEICHYILAGLVFVMGGFAVIYIAFGVAIVTEGFPPPQQQINGPRPFQPEMMGWIFIGVGSIAMAFAWCLAGALVVAGRCLRHRKSRLFCLIVAGLACLFQPIGTILGVFTFIVLLRPSVGKAFEPVSSEPPEFDTYRSE